MKTLITLLFSCLLIQKAMCVAPVVDTALVEGDKVTLKLLSAEVGHLWIFHGNLFNPISVGDFELIAGANNIEISLPDSSEIILWGSYESTTDTVAFMNLSTVQTGAIFGNQPPTVDTITFNATPAGGNAYLLEIFPRVNGNGSTNTFGQGLIQLHQTEPFTNSYLHDEYDGWVGPGVGSGKVWFDSWAFGLLMDSIFAVTFTFSNDIGSVQSDTVWFVLYNGDTDVTVLRIADADNSSTGIQLQEKQIDFTLYPNPTTGIVNIDVKNFGGKSEALKVVSLDGKVVLSQAITRSVVQLDLQNLERGVYFIQIGSHVQKIMLY